MKENREFKGGEILAMLSDDRKQIVGYYLVAVREGSRLVLVDMETGLTSSQLFSSGNGVGTFRLDDPKRFVELPEGFIVTENQKKQILDKAKCNLRECLAAGKVPLYPATGKYAIVKMIDSELDDTNWPITAWVKIEEDKPAIVVNYNLQGEPSIVHSDLYIDMEALQ